jgi:hypothetical protein
MKHFLSHQAAAASVIALGIVALSASGAVAGPLIHDYTITTSQVFFGTVSGSFETSDSAITSFDIVSTIGASTFTFDSAVAGSSSSGLIPGAPETLAGDTPFFSLLFKNAIDDSFLLDVTGGFASGLAYVAQGTPIFLGGFANGIADGATTLAPSQDVLTSDDITLLETTPSAIPEPASLALFGGGLVGLVGLLRTRRKSVAAI